MMWVVPLQAVIFFGSGIYRGMWRYASVPDLQRIALAVGLSTLLVALMLVMLPHEEPPVPRSVIMLDPILLLLFLGGSRLGYRIWKERLRRYALGSSGPSVVVFGAGDAAADILKNLATTGLWRVRGLLDDNPAKHGRQIHRVNVLGPLESFVDLAPRLGVERAIIAMPEASHQSRRRALEICRRAGAQALTVPSYQDLVSGKVIASQLRNVKLDDLHSRNPVLLDESRLQEWIGGRSVFVTGDGGSIGSELCRQIARFEPARLVLFEHNESALYRAEREFAEQHLRIRLHGILDDVRNAARVAKKLAEHRPEIVFHAAAYNHVPLLKEDNALAAVQNNVFGTMHVAEAAIALGVEKFVMVSADKGVAPTDAISSSKRLAEIVCQGLQAQDATKFIIARFGNVLISTSPEIYIFQEQIVLGGPITLPHPDLVISFSSIPDATRLILQASLIGNGGELFVFDMGEPLKLVDLAREYIWLSGYGGSDIGIEFTELRPSENLHQELFADDSGSLATAHPEIRIVKSRAALDPSKMEKLVVLLKQGNPAAEQVQHELLERILSLTGAPHRDI